MGTRIVRRYSRANDPEIEKDKRSAEACGYRHHTRRRNGFVEPIVVAPAAGTRHKAQTDMSGVRDLMID